ncbi:MAG TPA: hypothetical protein ENH49_04460 [Candidatus Marinimicrobia bacterium]|nr:hypothetical protein [Candidatus Neomarinimicrobiota bacterium]
MSFLLRQPIVRLWLFLSYSTAVLFSPTIIHWGIYGAFIFLLASIENISMKRIAHSLRSFIMFLPIMISIYLIISLLFSQSSLREMIFEIGWVVIKFSLVMAIMNVYSFGKYSGNVFDALRSIWVRMNKPWRKMEDWFLFLEMTLRFYPTFQRDWNRYNEIQKALGLKNHGSKLQQWVKTANQMPGMIILHLQKAEDIAQAMSLRGYGKQIPRGVAHFVSFNGLHLFVIIFISIAFISFHSFATV